MTERLNDVSIDLFHTRIEACNWNQLGHTTLIFFRKIISKLRASVNVDYNTK